MDDYLLDGEYREATDTYCRLVAANPAHAAQITTHCDRTTAPLGVPRPRASARRYPAVRTRTMSIADHVFGTSSCPRITGTGLTSVHVSTSLRVYATTVGFPAVPEEAWIRTISSSGTASRPRPRCQALEYQTSRKIRGFSTACWASPIASLTPDVQLTARGAVDTAAALRTKTHGCGQETSVA